MNRREFVRTGLIAVLIAPAAAVQAQQSSKSPRIGLLIYGSKSSFADRVDGFREGMRERGYVEGQNVVFVYRYADGKLERLPDLAELLVALKVDVIVTSTTPGIQAAMKATKTIPIVMASSADPVQSGLVASLARPGGNVTDVSSLAPDLDGKRLELLREIQPKLRKVGFLWDRPAALRRSGSQRFKKRRDHSALRFYRLKSEIPRSSKVGSNLPLRNAWVPCSLAAQWPRSMEDRSRKSPRGNGCR